MSENVILENNLIKCFSLLHKTQLVLGSNRIIIKDGAVKPPNSWHDLYSFAWIVCATCSEIYYQKGYFDAFYHRSAIMYYTGLFGHISEFVSYIASLVVARFTKREENITIYSLLQKIDRILQLHRDSYYTDFQARVQNRTVFLIWVFFPLGMAIHNMDVVDKPIYTVFTVPALVSLYMDYILCGGFLYFIAVRLSIFNKMMENRISKYENVWPEQKSSKSVAQMVLKLLHPSYDRIDNTLESNKWSELIQDILKCYQMLCDIFSFQILILAVTVTLWTFIAIGSVAEGLKSGLNSFMATFTIGSWAVFYFVLLTVAAVMNDWFLYQIKTTKMLCIRVMFYNDDDPYRKAASEILRIIHYSKPKFVVYGVFEINLSLPLTLMGIIATNVLVVIQYVVSRN